MARPHVPSFERLGLSAKEIRVLGVEYTHIPIPDQGDLYVTRFGLPFIEHLVPSNWNDDTFYSKPENSSLRVELRGSGHPRKVTTQSANGRSIDIVVKWCRVGTDVLLSQTGLAELLDDDLAYSAQWNSPFQEFGLLRELRDLNRYYRRHLHTQRPYAIYAPFKKLKLWQTGRSKDRMRFHHRLLDEDQRGLPADEAIDLDIQRLYALIYGWVKGEDIVAASERLSLREDLHGLTRQIHNDYLMNRGYRVLDIKPEHFIVRTKDGDVVRNKRGEIAFALIDFELLQRSRTYENLFFRAQRAKYYSLLDSRDQPLRALPRGLESTSVFGVPYISGETANHGRLWVVGNQPELFDYYGVSRWRRTPRIQLSQTTFRTTTLDGVYLVYKHSRVGMKPQQDPRTAGGRRAREFGFNSPFEEFAIAEKLRALGVRTVYPRAVYRTGHESLPVEWLQDNSRYESHAELVTGDGLPVLDQDHDYYSLWGCWRGVDPAIFYGQTEQCGVLDAAQAASEGLLSEAEFDELIAQTEARLAKVGFTDVVRSERVVLTLRNHKLVRDHTGLPSVTLCINGYRAYEMGLLDLQEYDHIVDLKRERLEQRGYTPHNLKGDHLLLATDPDGRLKVDDERKVEAVLCHFEEIRAPWMQY